jgi:hypothetical protein
LSVDDLQYVRDVGCPLLVINDAYRLAPWTDVLYAPDDRWWTWHRPFVQPLTARKFTLSPRVGEANTDVTVINFRPGKGISLDPTYIYTGGHAGYQGINLAVLLGAVRLILLGYDMQSTPDGTAHFFGNHPDGSHVRYHQWHEMYDGLPDMLARVGVSIVNASRETAITGVPRLSLDEALPCSPSR